MLLSLSERLINAAKCGDLESVKKYFAECLAEGFNPIIDPHYDAYIAPFRAFQNGHYEVFKFFAEHGAKLGTKVVDRSKCYPFYLTDAADRGDLKFVKLLLEHGVNVHEQNPLKLWRTPIELAAMNGHTDVVRLLLDYGARIDKADPIYRAWDKTPLMYAAQGGHLETVKLLLEYGANPNIKLSNGDSAIVCAAQEDHYEIVQLLLDFLSKDKIKSKAQIDIHKDGKTL